MVYIRVGSVTDIKSRKGKRNLIATKSVVYNGSCMIRQKRGKKGKKINGNRYPNSSGYIW